MNNKPLKIGIIGVGVVGSSVAKILEKNAAVIKARAGRDIIIKAGVVRDLNKNYSVNFPLFDNIDILLNDPEIDVILELMGGIELPFEIAKKALLLKKSFVTANKAMLAYHRYELQKIAGNIPIGFEASVAGGIPIIKALRDGLGANHINGIVGILNGTCNFILTKMFKEGASYETTLKDAQNLGYAESNPTFDVEGIDAAHKLLILASIAYGINAKPEDILIEGITAITQNDIDFAKEFGYSLKLLGIAKKEGNEVELRVHPALVAENAMIGKVDGVMNAVSVVGDCVGETLYYGAGAGGDPTASAVISDLIAIARSNHSPMLGFKESLESGLSLKDKGNIQSSYYARLETLDKPGVLAQITQIFSQKNISIDTFLQKKLTHSSALLSFATHECKESQIQEAMKEISNLNIVLKKPAMIRILK